MLPYWGPLLCAVVPSVLVRSIQLRRTPLVVVWDVMSLVAFVLVLLEAPRADSAYFWGVLQCMQVFIAHHSWQISLGSMVPVVILQGIGGGPWFAVPVTGFLPVAVAATWLTRNVDVAVLAGTGAVFYVLGLLGGAGYWRMGAVVMSLAYNSVATWIPLHRFLWDRHHFSLLPQHGR